MDSVAFFGNRLDYDISKQLPIYYHSKYGNCNIQKRSDKYIAILSSYKCDIFLKSNFHLQNFVTSYRFFAPRLSAFR
jgi:hypothetical protein